MDGDVIGPYHEGHASATLDLVTHDGESERALHHDGKALVLRAGATIFRRTGSQPAGVIYIGTALCRLPGIGDAHKYAWRLGP
jgi:hypothetical protein